MTPDKNFVFKKLDEGDIQEFNDLLRYAFQVTSTELRDSGWSNKEIQQSKQPIFDFSYVFGWFYKGKLASQIVIYPMKVNIQGTIFPMGGLTGVTTYPEYTGRGLSHSLIKRGLQYMREQGLTISYLYPYSIPFYRKQGWEIISNQMKFTIKDTQLPRKRPVDGMVQRVDIHHEDIKNLYKYFAMQHHGALIRGEFEWEEYWRWDNDDMTGAVYYSKEGKPLGYVIYYIENDIMHIKEIIHLNQEGKFGIWNFISAHYSMVDEVRGYNYTGDPIAFQFDDSEILETIQPYIMGRIVDVKEFMELYPFQEPDDNARFYFKVHDPVCEWNNGIFHLYFEDGEPVCEVVEEYEESYLVELNISTLTTMMMGYKRPTYLYDNGYLQVDYYLLRPLERLIDAEEPYFSDYF